MLPVCLFTRYMMLYHIKQFLLLAFILCKGKQNGYNFNSPDQGNLHGLENSDFYLVKSCSILISLEIEIG